MRPAGLPSWPLLCPRGWTCPSPSPWSPATARRWSPAPLSCARAPTSRRPFVPVRQGGAQWGQTPYPAVDLPCILVSDMRQVMAPLADRYYGHPSGLLSVIGITGTKGKSSTAYYPEVYPGRVYGPSRAGRRAASSPPSTPTTARSSSSPISPPRSPWSCSGTLPTRWGRGSGI